MHVKPVLALVAAISLSGIANAQVADPVVAERGGAELTMSEIDARVQEIPEEHRAGFMDSPERIDATLNTLLVDEQLAIEALENGLDKDPLFEAEVELARQQILARRQLRHFRNNLELPDFEPLARERYLADPDKYEKHEQLELMHVLVMPKERTEEEARALAEQAREEALAGVPFEDLVEKYSDEKDKLGRPSTGKLHRVRRGMMVEPFEEAAFALDEPGELSDVVKTQYGYHVIKLIERTPRTTLPFEAVRDRLVAELTNDFVEQRTSYYLDSLRSKPLEADRDLVASLRTRYITDGTKTLGTMYMNASDAESADEDAAQ